jgi:hypothetical protein
MSKHVITTIVVAIVIGVVGFFGGAKYGENKAKAAAPAAASGAAGAGGYAARFRGAGSSGGAAAGGGLVTGQIIKQDSSSITVQLPGSAGTKLVLFSPNTTVGRIATGTVMDLMTGESVVVTGTANSDGSVSATSIQVRPAGMGGFGGGQGGGSQASSTTSGAPMIPYQPGQ